MNEPSRTDTKGQTRLPARVFTGVGLFLILLGAAELLFDATDPSWTAAVSGVSFALIGAAMQLPPGRATLRYGLLGAGLVFALVNLVLALL